MFGKRSLADNTAPERAAPPPAGGDGGIATRPQRVEPQAASQPRAAGSDLKLAPAAGAAKAAGPKSTTGFEQLRAAHGAGGANTPIADVVHQQSDYYHATKTTIFNALLNTIDLSQLAQLDTETAAQEIRDIVAELVAIKNVSMSVAEQEHLVQDIINDVLGYGPLEPLLSRDDIADIMVNGAQLGQVDGVQQGVEDGGLGGVVVVALLADDLGDRACGRSGAVGGQQLFERGSRLGPARTGAGGRRRRGGLAWPRRRCGGRFGLLRPGGDARPARRRRGGGPLGILRQRTLAEHRGPTCA